VEAGLISIFKEPHILNEAGVSSYIQDILRHEENMTLTHNRHTADISSKSGDVCRNDNTLPVFRGRYRKLFIGWHEDFEVWQHQSKVEKLFSEFMAQQTYMFMIMKLLHYHKVIIYSVKKK